jgi:hypothetical protein
MMRLAALVAVSFAVVACSSSAEDDAADACPVVGTYDVALTQEEGGTCGGGGKATYTISRNGAGYALEVPGLQGACALEDIGGCRAQGKCDIALTDAVDPANAVGGVSFAWTFSASGFTGVNTLVLPAAKSMPDGCQSRYALTGTRL